MKRGCRADEAQNLADQFNYWGTAVRIEVTDQRATPSTKDKPPSPNTTAPVSSLTLAEASETIPIQLQDLTAPSVLKDHLQLDDHWAEENHCERH